VARVKGEVDTASAVADHRRVASVVGREREWSVIERVLDQAAHGPIALVIEGQAGIGKSTLWAQAVEAARERGFDVLASRPAESERRLANVVLGDLFASTATEDLAGLAPPRRRAFESALLIGDASTHAVDDRALGVAILTILTALAARAPVLIAIDDDQWMDPSSAATLSFALRRLEGHPVSLLLCRRASELPPAALEDALVPVERFTVGPLSVGAMHSVLRERLGAALSRSMQLRLHEVSGGNPFYALEVARGRPHDPAQDASAPLPLPTSLERVVAARLEPLDEDTRRAMLLIAAHGRFPVRAAAAVSLAPAALERARDARVIETTDGIARFVHPLFASAIYLGATDEERRWAHRQLATIVDDPVHRARHLALGADTPDEALAATIASAADLARHRGAPIAGAELADHALRLTPHDDVEERRRRTVAAVRAHSAAGDGRLARAMAADAVADAPAGRARAEALILASVFEAPAAAVAMLEEALVHAEAAPELQAKIHSGLAENGYFGLQKRTAFAEPHAMASLRLAERLDDDALRANGLSTLALIRFSTGHSSALRLAQRAYRLADQLHDPLLLLKAGWAVGHVLTWLGDTDRARDWLERQLAAWTERDERARADTLWYLALVELWAGRWNVAGERADQALEIYAAYGLESAFDFFPSALLAVHRGDFERARSLAERGLSMQRETQAMKGYRAIIAMSDAWSGDADAAIAQFARADDEAGAAGAAEPSMRFWVPEYVEVLLLRGRIREAADLVEDWEVAARPRGRHRLVAAALRCRGLIAAAQGDIAGAIGLLEMAVTAHHAAGDPFGQARSELALGANRRRAQQKRSAREALEAAVGRFADLGAASWAATARSELARIGGRSRLTGLSPSELSVAALVAEGRTNKEIASTLSLGERTVASHLTSIYGKLGIRSRTELARHIGPQGALPAEATGKVP
jgi:DNA-binding CsgD family transcriptional regulator